MGTDKTKMSASELQTALAGFTGTEHWYKLSPFHFGMTCTDGVKFFADAAEAYWLIDIIGSYQLQLSKKPFQEWTFTKDSSGDGAVVVCTNGNGKELARQVITFTDLDLPQIKFFVENQVCYLPSER
jgi:hypothetical protein